MHHWKRSLLALAAPLLLTGCLWGPGKFVSTLDLRKDGSFTLDYRGEIVLDMPDEHPAQPWNDTMAQCRTSGVVARTPDDGSDVATDDPVRPCKAAEIAIVKAQFDKEVADRFAKKSKENAEMAKVFGLPGLDDQSARACADKLRKYVGWRSVTYRGAGVFEVDYHFTGRATQDFL